MPASDTNPGNTGPDATRRAVAARAGRRRPGRADAGSALVALDHTGDPGRPLVARSRNTHTVSWCRCSPSSCSGNGATAARCAACHPSWSGLGLLLFGAALRLTAAHLYFEPLDAFSLVPTLAGLVWLAFGWQGLRWAWPAVAFLVFMLPLPFQVEGLLAQPLRALATTASTYALQTLGYAAVAEGNHILIDDVRLGVADACSGLGMLMTFFALAPPSPLILQPSWPDRVVIIASAVPIALVANVARITLTGVVHVACGAAAGQFVHDPRRLADDAAGPRPALD